MIELKRALRELSAHGKLRLFFWYSAKGPGGKPTVLASRFSDRKKDEDLDAALQDPKFKLAARGSMSVDPDNGALVLKTKGKAPAAGALEKGAFTAVLNARAGSCIKRVMVGEAGEEDLGKELEVPMLAPSGASAGETVPSSPPGEKAVESSAPVRKPSAGKAAFELVQRQTREREAGMKLQAAVRHLLKTAVYGSRQAPDEGVRILTNVDRQLRSLDAAFTKAFPGSKLRQARDINQVLDMIPKKVQALKAAAVDEVADHCNTWRSLAAGKMKQPETAPSVPKAIQERAELLLEHINQAEEGVKRDRAMLQRLGNRSLEADLAEVEQCVKRWRAEWESLTPRPRSNATLQKVPEDSSRPEPKGIQNPEAWKKACDKVEADNKAGSDLDVESFETMTKGAENALAASKKWNWEKDLKDRKKFNCDWNKVKAKYKELRTVEGAEAAKEFMSGYWWFRRVTVDRTMKQLADKYHFRWESVGSTNPESDYDISVKTHGTDGQETRWDWQIVADFNKAISQRFGGVQPGTLFDTNLYASAKAPEPKAEENKTQVERDMDAMTEAGQDVGALMKMRRYMDWEEFNDYEEEVLDGLKEALAKADPRRKAVLAAQLKLATRHLEEADSLYFLSLKKTLEKANEKIPAMATPDTIEGQKMLIELVERLEENPDKLMEATNDAYVEAMTEVRKVEKEIRDEDSKGAKGDPEQRAALLARLKTLQTDAVYFASEAYHSEGPFKHVVEGLQKKDQTVLAGLRLTELMQSFNEQLGDFMKDLRHYEHKSPFPGLGFYRSSKYLDRLCDAMIRIGDKLEAAKSEVAEEFNKIAFNNQSPKRIQELLQPLLSIRGGKAEFNGVEPDQQQQEAEAFAAEKMSEIFGGDVKTLRDLGQKIKAVGVKVNRLLRQAEAGQKMMAQDERRYFRPEG